MIGEYKKDIIKLSLALALFVGGMILGDSVIGTLFFASAYLLAGLEVLLNACKNIAKGKVFDENFLMAIATIGAILTAQFAEGVAVMIFYQLGELLQDIAVGRSKRSITRLMDLRPDYVNVIEGEKTLRCAPEDVKLGAVILLKPGERAAVDCVVTSGETLLDCSAITGEPVPIKVKAGDNIFGGSVVQSGVITAMVSKIYAESTVAKIIDLVQNSASKKAKAENFITRFARIYTPVVVILAVLLALLPPIIGLGSFNEFLLRALAFLVISCPCALVISVPLGFFVGIGGASKLGVLIKGGNYLEALGNCKTVVFDKTGTLTEGNFKVTGTVALIGTEEELLATAAMAESFSDHPVANSIIKACGTPYNRADSDSFSEVAGRGVIAVIGGETLLAGNIKLMEENGVKAEENDSLGTTVYIAKNGQYLGYIVVSDSIRDDAAEAISELRAAGVTKLVMLTGDRRENGEKVAKTLGLTDAICELLPSEKVAAVEKLIDSCNGKDLVAFAGDGINDAPVIARADVGIAMGGIGSDAAIEAADIVIMSDKLKMLAPAIRHSRRTMAIIRQNIVFALGVKILVLALAAFGLAGMWGAVLADVGVTIVAVLNAMRAMRVK